MFESKKQKNLSCLVFTIYMLLLIWLVLFKFSTSFRDLDHIRNINLIPFGGSMIVNGHLDISEIIYNIMVFVPLGVYVNMFFSGWNLPKRVFPGFVVSFLFETLQYIFAIGASDITDLIGNTLGGLLGIAVFFGIKSMFRKKYISVINGIGLVIEILALLFLGTLIIANM